MPSKRKIGQARDKPRRSPEPRPIDGALAAIQSRWTGPPWARFALLVEVSLGLLALLQLGRIANVFRFRLLFPFELEWMEGAVVDHVQRVISGEALYVEPSLSFTPFIYTPFYYGVSAAACQVLGIGLLGPRLVSVLATIGSLYLIGSFVHRETRDPFAAFIACAWFVTTYELTGYWFDIARVDSLFLFLTLASLWLARFGRSFPVAIAAGLVLFLAFFTKQTALSFVLPLVAFAFVHGWKHAISSAATFALATGTSILWMNHTSRGWFGYYVFHVPGQHDLLWDRAWPLLTDFLLKPVLVPLLFTVALLLLRPRYLQSSRLFAAHLLLLLTAVGSAYSSLLHRDGFVNVMIPAYGALSVASGMGFAWVRSHLRRTDIQSSQLAIVAALAWTFAFATLSYDPTLPMPRRADQEAGRTMVATLERRPGSLWMPGTGHFPSVAGHDASAHAMALADIFKTREPRIKQKLLKEVLHAIHEKRFAMIVLDPSFTLFPPEVAEAVRSQYRLEVPVYPPSAANAGWPKSGFRSRPEEIWVPR